LSCPCTIAVTHSNRTKNDMYRRLVILLPDRFQECIIHNHNFMEPVILLLPWYFQGNNGISSIRLNNLYSVKAEVGNRKTKPSVVVGGCLFHGDIPRMVNEK